jgi:hypothetical protein
MFQTVTTILKWASVPLLILVLLLSCLAGRYEGLLNLTICLGAVVFIRRAAWLKEYGWASVSVVAFVAFSPLPLVTKIFLLMSLAVVAATLGVLAACRPRRVAAL